MKTKFHGVVIIYFLLLRYQVSLDVEPVNLTEVFVKSPNPQSHMANDGVVLLTDQSYFHILLISVCSNCHCSLNMFSKHTCV